MSAAANVVIHRSQFPENIRQDLLKSLRSRKISHKFHYDSVKQTQKWLALHQQYSPSRNDENCRAIYEQSFEAVAGKIKSKSVHLIGLGCGGGQKDIRLLKMLNTGGKNAFYTPCDVAVAMVLTARQTALAVLPEANCFPLVCDLQTADNPPAIFYSPATGHAPRIITFFGMIPNFEPGKILPKLASLVRPKDYLLFSANLAPGKDFAAGVEKILPQYDNALTRDWLLTFLLDLGIERGDGQLRFEVEDRPGGLRRIAAHFHFKRQRRVEIEKDSFLFKPRESIRLFFSYRYTPERVRRALFAHKLKVLKQWVTESGEEGVFLCTKG